MKQPNKVALIDVRDCPREDYGAYWQITITGDDADGYRWHARLMSYKPLGYQWQGKRHQAWPKGVTAPSYPSDEPLARQADYLKMSTVHGYALPLPIDPLADVVRDLYDWARYLWRKCGRPLLALAYSTTVRNNRMVQVRDAIDAGAGAGLMRVYDGARPASCGAATTLLAELTHSDPCAGAPSGGALTFSAITADASANATGTATWYRDVDSTGTCCVDGNVGTAGAEYNLNSTSISTGQQVSCTSKVYTEGNA